MLDLEAALQPVGSTTTGTPSASAAAMRSAASVPPAMGALGRRLASRGVEVASLDSLGAPFWSSPTTYIRTDSQLGLTDSRPFRAGGWGRRATASWVLSRNDRRAGVCWRRASPVGRRQGRSGAGAVGRTEMGHSRGCDVLAGERRFRRLRRRSPVDDGLGRT